MAYQRNPIKNAPSVEYDGREIEPINKMHWKQQIHKYNMGLFTTGIVAMVAALITLIASIMSLCGYKESKAVASVLTTSSVIFVITLGIDIVLTIMLNKYYKNKLPLILFIPAFVLIVIFCVPEIIGIITVAFNLPDIKVWAKASWSSYCIIVVCVAFIALEILRMIRHQNDLNIYEEVKKALK